MKPELRDRLTKAQEIIQTLELELREADRGLIALTAELEARAAALEESEARFRLMVEGSEEVFFFIHGPDGRFTYLSPSVERVLGHAPRELLDTSYQSLLTAAEENEEVLARTSEALDSKRRGATYVAHVRHRNGREVCLEIAEQPVRRPSGALVVQGFARDVTEQRRRQEALRETTRLMNAMIEASPAAIYVVDRDTRVGLWNPAAERLFGWAAEEVLGRSLPKLPEQDDGELERLMQQSLAGQAFSAMDVRRFRRDGRPVDVNVSTAPLYSEEGRIDGVVVVVMNVTEKKEAERALVRSEDRYRRLFEEDLTGDFIAREDGSLIACNASFTRIFGYDSVEHALDVGVAPVFTSAEECEAFFELIRSQGEIKALERPLRKLDGKTVHVIGSAYGVFEGEELTEVRGHVLDVTETRLLEKQLLQAQKMEAVGRLAGGVAHDFNNILTAITGHAEFAMDHLPGDDPAREEVEEVRANAERAADLTRQLLAFSRQQLADPKVVEVAAVVREMEKMLRRLIGEDVVLETRLEDGRTEADPGQLQQVLLNLVVNARDALPEGGRVVVEVRPVEIEVAATDRPDAALDPGDYMLLTVSDTGHGMDAATRQHLFEPFFTTKEVGKGTGLGLATVYGIVKNAGGDIRVESEPGEGATFKVYLPRVYGHVEQEERDVPVSGERRRKRGGSVLVVEDEAAVRALVSRVLRRQGFEVLETGDPREALALVEARSAGPDLVVSDVVMPHMSGRELATALREHRPDLPVVFMSGYTEDEMMRRGVAGAGYRFIEKPFTPAQLVEKVEDALDEG